MVYIRELVLSAEWLHLRRFAGVNHTSPSRFASEMEGQKGDEQYITTARHLENKYVFGIVRRHYLFFYNLLQFLGFSWTLTRLTADLILLCQGALSSAFTSCAVVLNSCQMLAALEVMNATLGLVKSPVFPMMIQVVGRNVVLFVVFGSLPQMQGRSVVFCVFYLWSTMDMLRYLAQAVASVGIEWRALVQLRNASWMLLYPLTTVAEAAAVFQSLSVFDESGVFSLPLPEEVGFSISFSFSLRLYLILMLLGFLINFRHLLISGTKS